MAFLDTGPAPEHTPDTAPPATKSPPEITDTIKRTRLNLVERLVDQAAKGIAPWNKKLDPAQGDRLPYSPFSKAGNNDAMRGVNGLQLASVAEQKGFKDPRWISRLSMQERGWSFKMGEKGTNIEYYTPKGKQRAQLKHDSQGNAVFDEAGNQLKETVVMDKSTVSAIQMFNLEQVAEGKHSKTPIPDLDTAPRAPALAELNKVFAKSGIEIMDAQPGKPSHVSAKGKGAIYLSPQDKADDVAKAQLMVRGLAARALTLDTAGGWSQSDSDRTKWIKTELRVELATRILSDKFAIPTKPERLNGLNEHIAQVLNQPNGKTKEQDQIRFAARDADRAITRVLEGNWSRSQEWDHSQSQGQEQEAPEQEQPQRQAKAPAKGRGKSRGVER